MKKDMIQLPIRFGFHEYFDSQNGKGYGSSNFSWTAALFIDLVHEYYHKDKHDLDWLKIGKTRRLGKRRVLNRLSNIKASPSKDTASHLMAAIRELKESAYDLNRGLVDYEAIIKSNEYGRYLEMTAQLKTFDPTTLYSPAEKMAFWINLYNTIVVHGIIELGITASVKEVPDFFKKISYQIGEFTFSPDEMEHGILRANARPPYRLLALFKRSDPRVRFSLNSIDPRIHFALVCGSRSCAPISFYEADSIERQLDIATKNFINSSEVVIIPEQNKIFLSQIFKWYGKDFKGKEKIFQFLLKYLYEDEKSTFLKSRMSTINIEYLFYDWNLNH